MEKVSKYHFFHSCDHMVNISIVQYQYVREGLKRAIIANNLVGGGTV